MMLEMAMGAMTMRMKPMGSQGIVCARQNEKWYSNHPPHRERRMTMGRWIDSQSMKERIWELR